jgi:hypothetical protein
VSACELRITNADHSHSLVGILVDLHHARFTTETAKKTETTGSLCSSLASAPWHARRIGNPKRNRRFRDFLGFRGERV